MTTSRALLALVLLCSPMALAEGPQIAEKDLQTYVKLYEAQLLASARAMYARGDANKRADAQAGFPKALSDAGWSQEKWDEIDREVHMIDETLRTAETGTDKEAVEEDKRALAEQHDPAVVSWVRAHRKEVQYTSVNEKAEAQARAEDKQVAAGKAPSKADLQGTWKFDIDASMAHVKETMGVGGPEIRKALTSLGETTYIFSGDNVETRTLRPGSKTPEVNKGTFRIEGNDFLVKSGTSKHENKMQVGLKSPKELIFSMMGAGSVYTRQ
jgi:hypothetical protein